MWAKNEIKQKIGIEIPNDEVAHIALHLHTAKLDAPSMSESLKQATILNDFVHQVESFIGEKIEESSINYQRLVTHLRFALNRIQQGEAFDPIDQDMLELIKVKYNAAYEYSQKILDYLSNEHTIHFPSSEVAYIAIHIQRLIK